MNIHHDNHLICAVVVAMIPVGCARGVSSMSSEEAGPVGSAVSMLEEDPPPLVGWEGPSFFFMRDTMIECISHADTEIACPSRYLTKHVVPHPEVRRSPYVWGDRDNLKKITICCPDPSWLVSVTARNAPVDGGTPEPCAHIGIPECDALAALYEVPRYQRGEQGASKEIFTCDMWRETIALHGQDKVRTACMASSELTRLWPRLPKAPASPPTHVPGTSLLPSGGSRPTTLTSPTTPPVTVPGDPDPAEVR